MHRGWSVSNFGPNPDADMLELGRAFAADKDVDSIIGLGGGSSLDCAKGINFLLTQGGPIHALQGYGKASKPMLPMIGVPTTAGTGSEAQSYAIISDPATHKKMACGDPKAAFRAVILDPRLTLTQPPAVTAAAGYDAIAHAVESFGAEAQCAIAGVVARALAPARRKKKFERVMASPTISKHARGETRSLLPDGDEHSMMGATHACANADRTVRNHSRRCSAICCRRGPVNRLDDSQRYPS